MKPTLLWLWPAGAALLLAGCANVDPGPAFSDVQQTVAARTGHKIAWSQNTTEDRAAADAVDRLLRRPLSTDDAVQIALLNNPGLQATYEDIGISQAALVQAGLLKNPVFSGSMRFPDAGTGLADVELAVTEDFMDVFMVPLRKRVAATQLEQTKLEVGSAVLDLVAEVKEACYTLQGHQQLLATLEQIRDINQSGAELAAQQNKAGTLNELETESQTVPYTQSQADITQTQVEIDGDREKLNRLMGLSGVQIEWTLIATLPPVPARQFSQEQLEAIAMANRLDVAAARAEVVKLGQAAHLTDITRWAPGGVDIGADTEKESDERITGPVLDVQVPIFDQGQAQVAKARDELAQARARLRAAEVNARADVREARHRLQAAHDLATFYHDTLLPQRVKILALAQTEYNAMLKGAYDLLEDKEHVVDAERASIEAQRDYWIARAELEHAVGGSLTASPARVASTTTPTKPTP